MQTTFHPETALLTRTNADRLGVVASVLCAIHCALAPILFLFLPAFGRVWAHPATHWGMAIFVVPIAIWMTYCGFRKHRRKWVIATASFGIAFVLMGSALPYLEIGKNPSYGISFSLPGQKTQTGAPCVDTCCPSTTQLSGKNVFFIPPAAIFTTIGGIALIITHLVNLRCCTNCRLS
ncbi:MAG: MerC domain-containing protein [Akkermansiaceae bacterium]